MKKLIGIILLASAINVTDAQWLQISNGIGNDKSVNALVANGTNIFAGTSFSGVFLSTNNGTNWTQTTLNDKSVNAFIVIAGKVYAGTDNGVYVSANNGASWIQAGLNNYEVYSLTSVGSIFLAGTDYGVHRSLNNGGNWSQTMLSGGVISALAVTNSIIYAGILNTPSCSVFYCPVADTAWSQTSLNDKEVHSLAVLGTNIIAGSEHGVFLSSGYGTFWAQIGLNYQAVYALITSGSSIIAGTSAYPIGPAGVFVTTNNGAVWSNKSQGLLFIAIVPDVNALLIANNYIFAGTTLLGSVYRRPLSEVIGIQNIGTEVPSSFSLKQNYPNPFNPVTKIRFDVPGPENVLIKVYDMLGREIEILVNQKLQPGTYEVEWDASSYPSGVYLYRLDAGTFTQTRKMLLIK